MLFRYPKLLAFLASVAIAYLFFVEWGGSRLFAGFGGSLVYTTAFLAGLLYSYGFTSPFAAGVFLSLQVPGGELLKVAVVGGLGAFLADYSILKLVRVSMLEELERLKKTRPAKFISRHVLKLVPPAWFKHLVFALGALIIASPLPDEIGVSLLAGFTRMSEKNFALVSFTLNTLGILAMLLL